MGKYRKPTEAELKLLKYLIEKAALKINKNWQEDLLVTPMPDGNMGSLLLIPKNISNETRRFGKQVSEYQFTDEDGVEVN